MSSSLNTCVSIYRVVCRPCLTDVCVLILNKIWSDKCWVSPFLSFLHRRPLENGLAVTEGVEGVLAVVRPVCQMDWEKRNQVFNISQAILMERGKMFAEEFGHKEWAPSLSRNKGPIKNLMFFGRYISLAHPKYSLDSVLSTSVEIESFFRVLNHSQVISRNDRITSDSCTKLPNKDLVRILWRNSHEISSYIIPNFLSRTLICQYLIVKKLLFFKLI